MSAPARWLYHALLVADDLGDPYAPASLTKEGYLHASFAPTVEESTQLYFAKDAALVVFQIDPRRLTVAVDVVDTPRGPMPHLLGPLDRLAIVRRLARDELEGLPDPIV